MIYKNEGGEGNTTRFMGSTRKKKATRTRGTNEPNVNTKSTANNLDKGLP